LPNSRGRTWKKERRRKGERKREYIILNAKEDGGGERGEREEGGKYVTNRSQRVFSSLLYAFRSP